MVSIDTRKLFEFVEKLRGFVYGVGLLADEFSKRADALESMMDEVDDLTDEPVENNEAVKVLTNAIIRFAGLSIDYVTNELNKEKEELRKMKEDWGGLYGDDTN